MNNNGFELPTPVMPDGDSQLWQGVKAHATTVDVEPEYGDSPWGKPIQPPAHQRTVVVTPTQPASPLRSEPVVVEEPAVKRGKRTKQAKSPKPPKEGNKAKANFSMPKLTTPKLPKIKLGVPAPIQSIAIPTLSAALILAIADARFPELMSNGLLLYGMAGASGLFHWLSLGVYERAVTQRMRVKVGTFLVPLTSLLILLSVDLTVVPYSALVGVVYWLLFPHLRGWEKWVFGVWVAVAIGLIATLLV